jgi:SAUR family protein
MDGAKKIVNRLLRKVNLSAATSSDRHRNLLRSSPHPSTASLTSMSLLKSASSRTNSTGSMGSSRQSSWESLPGLMETEHCGSSTSCACPRDVPEGCLAVYVGTERRRFVIATSYLTNGVFQVLLAKSAEEFGFRCDGGLRIACCPEVFEHLIWWLQQQEGAKTQHAVPEEKRLSFLD